MIALFTPQELLNSTVTGRAGSKTDTRPALNSGKVDAIIGMCLVEFVKC